MGIDPAALNITLTLPSNEAVREAVAAGAGAACPSPMVCTRAVLAGVLAQANIPMPPRPFFAVRNRELYFSKAAAAFLETVKSSPALASLSHSSLTEPEDKFTRAVTSNA